MRIFISTTIAVIGIAVAIISSAIASQPGPTTIEGCAAMLPQGKTYTFELTGNVDTTGPAPKLSGEMSVSDGTYEDGTAQSEAFGQCIAKLIR